MTKKTPASEYRPWDFEKKWEQEWEKNLDIKAIDFGKKKKYYALVEFPYPSGSGLHVGHAFNYVILDPMVRMRRMRGENVLYPMGWDAFGLPTENYALKEGIHPIKATKQNTDSFRKEMKRLGFAFNWDREINTTDPDYYRWTQWIFIQLFKAGLAYKDERPVGWCPACKIILANEEIVGGNCERCGHSAERRMQSQWLLRITAYADRLAKELDLVDYPDYIKASQRNWIGKTEGIEIEYPVVDSKITLSCYSTRPETNFGATFIVIAPEHPLVEKLTSKDNKKTVSKYIKEAQKKSELERTELSKDKGGVFTGSFALNRLTGKRLPIWVADFVVLTAGTGIVVGVPAHDQRDFEFAKKHDLEIIPVIQPKNKNWDFKKAPYLEIDQGEMFNSDFLNGLAPRAAIKKIIAHLVDKKWGKRAVNYKLRDWIFSRQHYWGEPIPMIYCPACAKKGKTHPHPVCDSNLYVTDMDHTLGVSNEELAGWFPVSDGDLPVKLPQVEKYQPTETGESPLAAIKSFVETKCPVCGGRAKRETDTMPNWAGSSWYYLAYCFAGKFGNPKKVSNLDIRASNFRNIFRSSKNIPAYWLPADVYLGGSEHTTLHVLYSRFWHKALNDLGLVPGKEPYGARRQHGVILGEDGEKMSKSKGNVVNPGAVMDKFGADTLRLYLMFMGPYEQTMPWNSKGVEGCWRFLNRVWRLFARGFEVRKLSEEEKRLVHKLIKRVGEDTEKLDNNTAIAALMEGLNDFSKLSQPPSGCDPNWYDKNMNHTLRVNRQPRGKRLPKEMLEVFCLLLAPFAPFAAEEIWINLLENKLSVHKQSWPKFDKEIIKEEMVTVVVQVNGKLRSSLKMENGEWRMENKVVEMAKNDSGVARHLEGKKIKRTIFVPGRLINFVI